MVQEFNIICGISWYGWSANAGIQWIMPIIGTAFIGFGRTQSIYDSIFEQQANLVNLPRPVDCLVRI